MDATSRRFQVQDAVGAALRGGSLGAFMGLATGLAELFFTVLAGETVLVARPLTHPLPFIIAAGCAGALLGVAALGLDACLRRLGRPRPRCGLLVPVVVGILAAAYTTGILSAVRGLSASVSAADVLQSWLVLAALSVAAACAATLLAPVPDGWSGKWRGLDIGAVAALALGLASYAILRRPDLFGALGRTADAVVFIAHPATLALALVAGAVIVRKLGNARAAFVLVRPGLAGLVVAAAVTVMGFLSSGGDAPDGPSQGTSPRPPNFVVVVLDGARADSVSALAKTANPTAGFDEVAATGTLFTQARSASNACLDGNLAILTGSTATRYAAQRPTPGMRPAEREASAPPTLAEALAALGYDTAGFSNGAWVGPATGLDAGFRQFFQMKAPSRHVLRLTDMLRLSRRAPYVSDDGADATIQAAATWLTRRGDAPFLLFIHLSEPLPPWTPPASLLLSATAGAEGVDMKGVRQACEEPLSVTLGSVQLTWRQFPWIQRIYQADVASACAGLATLWSLLDQERLSDGTTLVVTSDHGMEFDELTRVLGHEPVLTEAVLRVPLALRGPGVPSGMRLDVPVSTLDIAPTLLEMAGAPLSPRLDGQSLVPLLRGAPGAQQALDERGLVVESGVPHAYMRKIRKRAPDADLSEMERYQVAVIGSGWKLRRDSKGRLIVHDLRSDPTEANAAWGALPEGKEAIQHLDAVLQDWYGTHPTEMFDRGQAAAPLADGSDATTGPEPATPPDPAGAK